MVIKTRFSNEITAYNDRKLTILSYVQAKPVQSPLFLGMCKLAMMVNDILP